MLTEQLVAEAEQRFGVPSGLSLEARLSERELGLVASSLRRLRTHDVTMFILDGDRVAVIRKPSFPPGAFRAPSGGVGPGETMEQGALREALEETGLHVALDRYLLRVRATFRPAADWDGWRDLPHDALPPDESETIRWWTHVFLAHPVGGTAIAPIDTREIAEARWATVDELQGPIRSTLLDTGTALFRYRVALTDATVAAMQPSQPQVEASIG